MSRSCYAVASDAVPYHEIRAKTGLIIDFFVYYSYRKKMVDVYGWEL